LPQVEGGRFSSEFLDLDPTMGMRAGALGLLLSGPGFRRIAASGLLRSTDLCRPLIPAAVVSTTIRNADRPRSRHGIAMGGLRNRAMLPSSAASAFLK